MQGSGFEKLLTTWINEFWNDHTTEQVITNWRRKRREGNGNVCKSLQDIIDDSKIASKSYRMALDRFKKWLEFENRKYERSWFDYLIVMVFLNTQIRLDKWIKFKKLRRRMREECLRKKRVKRDRGEGNSSSCKAFKRGVCYLVTWVPIEPCNWIYGWR